MRQSIDMLMMFYQLTTVTFILMLSHRMRVSAKYRNIPQILRHLFYICVFTKIKTLMVTYKQHYLINVMILFFSIVNFPCLCSIYHHHLLIGFMYLSLLVMKVHALHINNFLNKASY